MIAQEMKKKRDERNKKIKRLSVGQDICMSDLKKGSKSVAHTSPSHLADTHNAQAHSNDPLVKAFLK